MKRNNAITGLRGIVILLIVFRHFSARYSEMFQDEMSIVFPFSMPNGGRMGNIIFMMMMGYFMTKSLFIDKYGIRESLKYIINRYWRFWPSYALSVIIISLTLYFFPLPERTPSLISCIVNFFFIIHPSVDNVDGSHWFLTVMLIIQIFLAMVLLVKNLRIRMAIIIGSTFFLLLIVAMTLFNKDFLPEFKDLFFYSLVTLAGILTYIYREKKILYPILFLLEVVIYFYTPAVSVPIVTSILIILFVLIIRRPLCFNLLEKNPFKFIGDLSFQWYLIHQNIGLAIMYYCLPKGEISMLWVLVPIMSTIMLAYIMNLALKNIPSKVIK